MGGGGVCETKAIHGVGKMVNYYPLIAHSAQRMKFFAEIMPHIVQLDHYACNSGHCKSCKTGIQIQRNSTQGQNALSREGVLLCTDDRL